MLLSELKSGGTYVAVLPIQPTDALLAQWATEQGIGLASDLHVTLLYSRQVIGVVTNQDEHFAVPVGFDVFDGKLVMKLECQTMIDRHDKFIGMGGTHDHPEYVPHLTLCSANGLVLDEIDLPPFSLVFGREYTEALRT